jgi:hypothetical protein
LKIATNYFNIFISDNPLISVKFENNYFAVLFDIWIFILLSTIDFIKREDESKIINREINSIGRTNFILPLIDLLFLIFKITALSLMTFLELNKSIMF